MSDAHLAPPGVPQQTHEAMTEEEFVTNPNHYCGKPFDACGVCDSVFPLKDLANAFFESLERECTLRAKRGGISAFGELEWIGAEREHMFQLVNRERASRGKPAVEMQRIRRAETLACGHCDYTRKFARYCVELVFDDICPVP